MDRGKIYPYVQCPLSSVGNMVQAASKCLKSYVGPNSIDTVFLLDMHTYDKV